MPASSTTSTVRASSTGASRPSLLVLAVRPDRRPLAAVSSSPRSRSTVAISSNPSMCRQTVAIPVGAAPRTVMSRTSSRAACPHSLRAPDRFPTISGSLISLAHAAAVRVNVARYSGTATPSRSTDQRAGNGRSSRLSDPDGDAQLPDKAGHTVMSRSGGQRPPPRQRRERPWYQSKGRSHPPADFGRDPTRSSPLASQDLGALPARRACRLRSSAPAQAAASLAPSLATSDRPKLGSKGWSGLLKVTVSSVRPFPSKTRSR